MSEVIPGDDDRGGDGAIGEDPDGPELDDAGNDTDDEEVDDDE